MRPIPTRCPLIMVLAFAVVGIAQERADAQVSSAEAEQLFRDGKRLMQEKKYAEACVAFETSHKIDPALTTKLNLADCREKNHQLATAWGLFVDAERDTRGDSKQSALNKTASSRATSLESRLSYLTISVPDESRVEGLTILRNGAILDEGLWNRAFPVDGGAIVIAGRAPGHEEWSTTATVPFEAGKVSVEVPRFKELRTLGTSVTPAPSEAGEPDPPRGDEAIGGRFTGQRKVSVGVAIAGATVLGFGGWMGTRARADERDAYALCPDPLTPCARAAEATALSDRSGSRALYANISLGLGAAAVVGAAILWLTGGPAEHGARTAFAPSLQPGFAGVDIRRSF